MRLIALLLLALVWLAADARAQAVFTFPEGQIRRDFVRLSSARLEQDGVYEAMVVRPARDGKFPLLVLSHGAPREREKAKERRAASWTGVAIEFARQGYVSVVFLRQGYGTSTGRINDVSGPCNSPDYISSGGNTAREIVDAIVAMKREAYVDPTRIVAVGQSAGGFGSLATAAHAPGGLAAVLNFAGGRGSPRPDEVCGEYYLVDAVGHFGKTARVPTLWVYSENDHYFGPRLAREMYEKWIGAGAKAEFIAAPPFGEDGHNLFGSSTIPLWRDYAGNFLKKLGLPSWQSPPSDTPKPIAPPSGLGQHGRADFVRYLASTNYNKAFVMGERGRYSWRSGFATREEAVDASRKACEERGGTCRAVFVDDAKAD
jgi:dienelactone hydrolase